MPAKRTLSKRPAPKGDDYVRLSDQLTDSLEKLSETIAANREIIDTVQDIAIQLTEVFANLHALTIKYAGIVNKALDAMLPVVDKIPFISDKIIDLLKDMERLTQQIVDGKDSAEKIIRDVDAGLRQGDMKRLQAHSDDLKKMTAKLQAILPDD